MSRVRERCLYTDVQDGRSLARWTVIKTGDGTWSVNAPSFLDNPIPKPFPTFDAAVHAAHPIEDPDPIGRFIDQVVRDQRSVVDQACLMALMQGTCGVGVRQVYEGHSVRTIATVDPDVPYGEIHYYPPETNWTAP